MTAATTPVVADGASGAATVRRLLRRNAWNLGLLALLGVMLALTRAIIDGIHSGHLADAPTTPDPVFGFGTVTACPGVPAEVLQPRSTWADASAYDETANKLATLFRDNFKKYEADVRQDVRDAGPRLGVRS